MLCDTPEEIRWATLLGVVAPVLVFQTAKVLLRRPLERLMKYFDGDEQEQVGFGGGRW